ncbi:group XIIA secretory phospholipase A2-like [Mercenaria mercenaria]|uniref:group XIIA secretory phospholipase A2-like n=1 Tax=Mercenaria mercenaria TaxID=6596 RepID=UPI00234F9033|nr:group XIIA secretory phospholipase A2-like [Mercenaria mercenaria]
MEEDDPADLGSAVEMLAGMFGGGECTYKCKNGNKPVAKAEHVPTSDGCGSSGIKIDTDDIPGAEDCCHEHDYCYDTCNSDRAKCDKEFKTCLHDTCNKLKTSKSKKKISYKDCKGTADIMYSGTLALGCDPFLKAQEKACHCRNTPKSGNDKKLNQKNDAKKKSAPDSAKSDKKIRNSQGRRSDEL